MLQFRIQLSYKRLTNILFFLKNLVLALVDIKIIDKKLIDNLMST